VDVTGSRFQGGGKAGDLVATGRFTRIVDSAENAAGDLGTGIFHVSDDVKRYIVEGLRRLATGDPPG